MVYNLQVNIMSMLLLCGAAFYMHGSSRIPSSRSRAVSRVIISAAAMCVSDIIFAACNGNAFAGARALLIISNMVYFEGVIGVCWAWLSYVDVSLGITGRRSALLAAIPFVFVSILTLFTPLTGFMFGVDAQNVYTRGSGVYLHWAVAWGYLITASIKVLARMKKTDSKAEKDRLRPLFDFIILPAAASVCQMLSYGVSGMQCGVAISIVLILAREMNERIQKDALTGLNNRGALSAYVRELFEKGPQELRVFMLDIDDFKAINDRHGHREGDRAIRFVADTLKDVCGNSGKSLFLCRYGGDEFVIVGKDVSQREADDILSEIGRRINMANEEIFSSRLGVSMGEVSGRCSSVEDAERLLETADMKMYGAKQSKYVPV